MLCLQGEHLMKSSTMALNGIDWCTRKPNQKSKGTLNETLR